jgi:hypothetical protein
MIHRSRYCAHRRHELSVTLRTYLLVAALTACGRDSEIVRGPGSIREAAYVPNAPPRQLDVLMVIDDSVAVTGPWQFSNAVGVLVDALAAVDGGLPDLHVGVTTTDLGTSGSLDPSNPGPAIGQVGNGGCSGQGRDGQLLTSGAAVNGSFLIDESAGPKRRVRNYTGTLADTLRTMVRVGSGGCGFEQPLQAVRRALSPDRNIGFRRANAALAILIVADEDDCSFTDARLVDPAATELGPLQSYRCTQFGITCNEDITVVGPKSDCRPSTDTRYVEDPATTQSFLAPFPNITVGMLIGTPEPVAIHLRAPPGGGQPILALANSCRVPDGLPAAPGVRLAAFADTFGSRGVVDTVCASDVSQEVGRLAAAIQRSLGTICLDDTLLADTSFAEGAQLACEAHEVGAFSTAIPQRSRRVPMTATASRSSATPTRASRRRTTCASWFTARARPIRRTTSRFIAPRTERRVDDAIAHRQLPLNDRVRLQADERCASAPLPGRIRAGSASPPFSRASGALDSCAERQIRSRSHGASMRRHIAARSRCLRRSPAHRGAPTRDRAPARTSPPLRAGITRTDGRVTRLRTCPRRRCCFPPAEASPPVEVAARAAATAPARSPPNRP